MPERTLRVPDAPGWWWKRVETAGTVFRLLVRIHETCLEELTPWKTIRWRGPIPEPTDEEWELSE